MIPLVRALRKELGTERANQIVSGALRGWSNEIYRKIDRLVAVKNKYDPTNFFRVN